MHGEYVLREYITMENSTVSFFFVSFVRVDEPLIARDSDVNANMKVIRENFGIEMHKSAEISHFFWGGGVISESTG